MFVCFGLHEDFLLVSVPLRDRKKLLKKVGLLPNRCNNTALHETMKFFIFYSHPRPESFICIRFIASDKQETPVSLCSEFKPSNSFRLRVKQLLHIPVSSLQTPYAHVPPTNGCFDSWLPTLPVGLPKIDYRLKIESQQSLKRFDCKLEFPVSV